jgi:hypothetical protein
MVLLGAFAEAGRKNRNLERGFTEPLVILGIIVAALVLPLVAILIYRVVSDPAFPLITKELYYRFMECCCDDGTWRAKHRRRRPQTFSSHDEEERWNSERKARRAARRDRKRNLSALADEMLEHQLQEAVETAMDDQ